MIVVDLQFSGVLNCQQPFIPWDEHPQTIEGGRLTGTSASSDDKVCWAGIESFDPDPHHGGQSAVDGAPIDQVDDGDRIFAELPNGECLSLIHI